MCGIFGAFGPSAASFQEHLQEASSVIAHRGPDANGSYISPNTQCLLGHRRLTILDLSPRANQPMKRGDLVLVYNGEIYNHRTFRVGFPRDYFSTTSDTESLLCGLARNPLQTLECAVGMFAGACFSEIDNSLLLFRDPLGIKPLYYFRLSDSTLIFGSEIKVLFSLCPTIPRRVSEKAFLLYLLFENYPQGNSLFEGVHLVKPGEVLRFKQNVKQEVTCTCSQFTFQSAPFVAPADIIEKTRETIALSVQEHLLSDVPLGVYLSGGLDSSLVSTFAAQTSSNLVGFTGYFRTSFSYYDERPLARDLARSLNIELIEIEITPHDFTEHFDKVIYHLDEPRMGMGAFSQFVVARTAAQHRKVILSGHGGDELFAGYPQFKAFWLLQTKKLSFEALRCVSSLKGKELPWVVFLLLSLLKRKPPSFAPELLQLSETSFQGRADRSAFQLKEKSTALGELEHYYRSVYLPGLLVVEDKISMAHGLETRLPLWSQNVVQLSTNIPIDIRLQRGELKSILKAVARPLLPPSLLSAQKRGFPTPLRLWFRNELRSFVRDRLLETRTSSLYQVMSRERIEQLISSHETKRLPFALDEKRAHKIWILLCLESWLRQFHPELHFAL